MKLVPWNVKNEAWAVNVTKGNGDRGSHEQAGMRKKKKMVMVIMSGWNVKAKPKRGIELGNCME